MNDLYNLYEGEFISTLREINDIIFNAQTNPKNCKLFSLFF